jgi:hypothetical protein
MATIAHAFDAASNDVDIDAARAAVLEIWRILDEPLTTPHNGDDDE